MNTVINQVRNHGLSLSAHSKALLPLLFEMLCLRLSKAIRALAAAVEPFLSVLVKQAVIAGLWYHKSATSFRADSPQDSPSQCLLMLATSHQRSTNSQLA